MDRRPFGEYVEGLFRCAVAKKVGPTILPEHRVNHHYDAIVIGGGPAGSFAALGLAQAGRSVLIVERRSPGTGKTCGHCLNARALPLLRRAGLLARVQAIAEGETSRLILRSAGHGELAVPLGPSGGESRGLITPRHRLDEVLLQSAVSEGAELVRPATASVWRVRDGEGIEVECRSSERSKCDSVRRVTARMVIGADGLRSAVARALGFGGGRCRSRPQAQSAGLSFDVDDDDGSAHCRERRDALDMALPRDAIAMHVNSRGYVGIVRTAGRRLHIGALLRQRVRNGNVSRAPGPASQIDLFMESFPEMARIMSPLLREAGIMHLHAAGPMPWRPRRLSNGVAALAGDAAGYEEPFTGEGLSWALESADLIVRIAISQGDAVWNRHAARQYERAWRRSIGARVRTCRLLAAVLRSRAGRAALPTALAAVPFAACALAARIWTRAPEFEA